MSDWNVSEEAAVLHADALVWDMTFPIGILEPWISNGRRWSACTQADSIWSR